MADWRLAKSLITLQGEVNAAYPNRPKGADGTIGDARHQAEQSDHNPLPPHPGVVTAWDITTAPFTIALAEWFRTHGPSDGRIKYVIYRARITSAQHGWEWVAYSGYSRHFDHIHLSVSDDPSEYDRTDPWRPFTQPAVRPTPTPTPTPDPSPVSQEDPDMPVIASNGTTAGHWLTDLLTAKRPIHGKAEEIALKAAGLRSVIVPQATLDSIPTVKA